MKKRINSVTFPARLAKIVVLIGLLAPFAANAQSPRQGFATVAGEVVLEKVTGYQIDTRIPAIDFSVVIRNRLNQTVFLREAQASGVRLQRRGGNFITVGTGSGTSVGTIEPVPGFPAVSGIEISPGLSTHTFRIALPADTAEMAANLIEIFNALNAGTGRRDVSMLFSLAGKGGIRDPHGVEWTDIEQNKRFSSNFDNLISFESRGDAGNLEISPAGAVIISRIGSAQVVTENRQRHLDLQVELRNNSSNTLAMRDPQFSHTAFFLGGQNRIPIGLGKGKTTQTFAPASGFPPVNGLRMQPGVSSHPIRFAMAADDAEALRNLVALMNVMGSPEQRGNVSLIFALNASAGIMNPDFEGIQTVEAQKNYPAVIRGEYLFE